MDKQIVDVRTVDVDEVHHMINALQSCIHLMENFTDNDSVLSEKIRSGGMTSEKLKEISSMCESVKGKGLNLKVLAVGKAMFPELAEIENAAFTMRSLHGFLGGLFMRAYAREFHKCLDEDAVMDHAAFRKMIEGNID